MARKVNFFNLAMKIAHETEKEARRKQNEEKRLLKEFEREQKLIEKQSQAQLKEEAIEYASNETKNSQEQREELISCLKSPLEYPIQLNWDDYKDTRPYSEPCPVKPNLIPYPSEINRERYTPKIPLIFHLFKSKKKNIIEESEKAFEKAVKKRNEEIKSIDSKNQIIISKFNKEKQAWLEAKENYEKEIYEYNKWIDEARGKFQSRNIKDEEKILTFYFSALINNFKLPTCLYTSWNISYYADSKIIIIDYKLPSKEVVPALKSMKYIVSRKEFSESYIKESDIDKIYNEMILQICLRITHDMYICDTMGYVESIVFNGMYTGVNKSTGIEETKCILSLQTKKEDFSKINIKQVDAKSCFKKFKGISGAKISELIPVAPILQFNKDDSRFVESIDISDSVNGKNIASMDWEEFEHLIRELFEKEFAVNGSEVRITQASRDGGVDAVMFDPDPIRGGKYIIQAKRYTNVVGVSAVRDLYGTLMNEGAIKGILVTTASYGADSYEFAKDKPITLIDGSNLLYILKKHGYKAYIDINEARSRMLNNSKI